MDLGPQYSETVSFDETAHCEGGKLTGVVVYTNLSMFQGRGPYAAGKRNGSWSFEFDYGAVLQGPYMDGEKHGRWIYTDPDRGVEAGDFVNGKRDGEWHHRYARSGVTVIRVYGAGELKDLRVVNPKAASNRADSKEATVPGGFGVAFGTDVTQLKSMMCHPDLWSDRDRNCLSALSDRLHDFRQEELDPRWWVFDVNPTDPPRPVAGGRRYSVGFSLWEGRIVEARTEFHFPSEVECEQEESRVRGLLEGKYGECRNPIHSAGARGYTPIGQCDSNGLIEREIRAYCTDMGATDMSAGGYKLVLFYALLSDKERERIRDAWMRTGRPDADSL